MRPAPLLAMLVLLASPAVAIGAELGFFQKLELREACAKDLEPLCGKVEAGGGRLAQCIHDNADKLTQPCRDTIERLRGSLLAASDEAMDF